MGNKYRYKFTELAEEDIELVLEYISQQLCNQKAASDLLEKIGQAIDKICLFPYSFCDCTHFLVSDEKIRHAIIENYVLIYEIKDEDRQINILRFRYARMDLTKLGIEK